MFKKIIVLSLASTAFVSQMSLAEIDGNCADSVQAAGKVESGVEAIRNSTGNNQIQLGTAFVQVDANGNRTRKEDGEFQVYAKGGELRVDTSKGDKPTVICPTKSGLQAFIFLSGFEAAFVGTNQIVLTLKGTRNGLLEISDNLPKKANEPEKTYFKPVF